MTTRLTARRTLGRATVCVVLLSATHAHAQEMDMTPQEIVFDHPITTSPEATSPEPAAPTVAPPPAAVPPTSPPTVATPVWQKSMAFQLRPPPEPVTYGDQIGLAYLLPIPMVPIIHGMHGNLGRGFLAVLGMYAAIIGGVYAGVLLVPEDDTAGHVPTLSRGPLFGFLLGWIGWALFDATTLAVEDPPPPAGRLPSFGYERR